MKETTRFVIEYAHCDAYGIVHNIEYVSWFENRIAQSVYLQAKNTLQPFVLTSVRSRFIHALRWGDCIEMDTEVSWEDQRGEGKIVLRNENKQGEISCICRFQVELQ